MATMGRPKGSGNKPLKRLLADRLSEKYPDFDPVMEMIEGSLQIKSIAESTGELSDYKAAVESFDRVTKYIQPSLKAIEVQTDNALTISVQRKRYDGSTATNVNDDGDSDNRFCLNRPPIPKILFIYIDMPEAKKK